MAWKMVGTCDGCRKEISLAEVNASNDAFMEWIKEKHPDFDPQKARNVYPEIYCADHISKAAEYWEAKTALERACLEEMRRRIEKHRNRFWLGGGLAKTELKVVGSDGV